MPQSNRPPIVYAQATVRSASGRSLFRDSTLVTGETIADYYADVGRVHQAVERLQRAGFDVLHVDPVTINIAAPAEVYERVFQTKIDLEEREVIKRFGERSKATFLKSADSDVRGLIDPSKSSLADVLEGVALEEPRYFADSRIEVMERPRTEEAAAEAPSFLAPAQSYWHLDVPGDVSLGMNADRAHRAGFTGHGVHVVMIDSGWYRHPFFTVRGYRSNDVVTGPGASDPEQDEHGHGTGESANIFSVAPDVKFTMIKTNFVNTTAAFNTAVALKPDIISCSWGSSVENGPLSAADQVLAAAIANAVKQGIIVVFSAGNGHWGFPGQHPDVISAGGTYMCADGTFQATPYASGFESNIYPGRKVPDVCGLVGLTPGAQYILLPVQPGNTLDRELSGGDHPRGDETEENDGWAAFSGTSAAAPAIAGVCALMKQANPELTPKKAREILKQTARDVTEGTSSPATGGEQATSGPDLATGYGLADAYRATVEALSGA